MKFQTKMVLYYTTIAIILSLGLGFLLYRTGLNYEMKSQRANLQLASRNLVGQMDEKLERMDAIMNYFLSDTDVLDSMKTMGRVSGGTVPTIYELNARATIESAIVRDYTMKNSYRTVFFNQNGYIVSSFVSTNLKHIVEEFDYREIPYIEEVQKGRGASVIVLPHYDRWGTSDGPLVYSLMKALRGVQMGFLEVENTVAELAELEVSDPEVRYIIYVNGREALYSNYVKPIDDDLLEKLFTLDEETTLDYGGNEYSRTSSDLYDLTIVTVKSHDAMSREKHSLMLTATIASLTVFAFCMVLITIYAGILTRPVRRLTTIMERTNLENLRNDQVTEEMKRGPDEFQALSSSYQSMTERLQEAIISEKRASMLQLQAQFDTLQAQVNPHFIYNVLNIISSRGVIDEDETICEMCAALAHMLRYSTNTKERYAQIRQEEEYLDSYFYLLKARYVDRISFDIQIDESVRDQLIPKMTLQQIVENCIQHGFPDSGRPLHISIRGRQTEDERWEVTVADDGQGIPEETLAEIRKKMAQTKADLLQKGGNLEVEIGGMGLVNNYARCLLLYNEDLIFEVIHREQGTIVRIGASV